MKNIYTLLLALAAATITFSGCSSDNDPYFTASEDDYPRILNTDLPETTGGAPSALPTIARDAKFHFEAIVTPTQCTTVTYYLNDALVHTGNTIDTLLLAGEYDVRIVATTTKNQSTSRHCTLKVVPLDGDPIVADGASRLFAPNAVTTVTGSNLSKVKRVFIGDKEAAVTAAADGEVTFTTPDMADGDYILVFADETGTRYGADKVTISSAPYVTLTELRAKPNGEVTISGINLHNMSIITVGGKQATIVSKSFDKLTFTCPALEPGDYDMTAQAADAKEVLFNGQKTCKVTVTAETTLWEGSFDVTWGTPFDQLKTTFLDKAQVGSVLRVYVEGEGEGQGTAATAWWTGLSTGKPDPERGDIMISGKQTLTFTITQAMLDLIKSQDGFLIVGNGYQVKRVTTE